MFLSWQVYKRDGIRATRYYRQGLSFHKPGYKPHSRGVWGFFKKPLLGNRIQDKWGKISQLPQTIIYSVRQSCAKRDCTITNTPPWGSQMTSERSTIPQGPKGRGDISIWSKQEPACILKRWGEITAFQKDRYLILDFHHSLNARNIKIFKRD